MIAVYPGSFDPATNGHLDIIERAARIFDQLIVTVFRNAGKNPLFTMEERVELLREATAHIPNVRIDSFGGLLTQYAKEQGARVLVKGLRAVSDFDYEFQMALMNKKLDPELETLFMMTGQKYSYLSSSIVKELAGFGGCIEGLVPPNVAKRLMETIEKSGVRKG
ncbi:MAG: pantetheine-phosphate adenylyltransferase [Firmicutes bacterium]|nr:pantetheine-phosphate adenylyltransferase [Bacillota bacterium]MCL5038318.1 pantetheine-phosphate adenylyltransferase [Bacillota bacterium]